MSPGNLSLKNRLCDRFRNWFFFFLVEQVCSGSELVHERDSTDAAVEIVLKSFHVFFRFTISRDNLINDFFSSSKNKDLQEISKKRGRAVPETRMRLPPRSNLSSSLSAVLPASQSENVTKPEPADLPVIGSEKTKVIILGRKFDRDRKKSPKFKRGTSQK